MGLLFRSRLILQGNQNLHADAAKIPKYILLWNYFAQLFNPSLCFLSYKKFPERKLHFAAKGLRPHKMLMATFLAGECIL